LDGSSSAPAHFATPKNVETPDRGYIPGCAGFYGAFFCRKKGLSGEICVSFFSRTAGINLSSAADKGEETALIYMVK
jgi:hypothetical protein